MKKLFAPLIGLFALLSLSDAQAFRVSPMVFDIQPSGPQAMETLRVENTLANTLNAEITVAKRVINEDGSQTLTPAEDDFLIFPPQIVLEPNKTQAVRVKYIGDPAITQSVGYVITVAQQAVKKSERDASGVDFVFEFGSSVNVVPKGAVPNLKVLSIKGAEGAALVQAENTGNAYARITTGTWHFRNASGQTYDLTGEALGKTVPQPLIQPQTKRQFRFTLPATFSPTGLSAEYTQ